MTTRKQKIMDAVANYSMAIVYLLYKVQGESDERKSRLYEEYAREYAHEHNQETPQELRNYFRMWLYEADTKDEKIISDALSYLEEQGIHATRREAYNALREVIDIAWDGLYDVDFRELFDTIQYYK